MHIKLGKNITVIDPNEQIKEYCEDILTLDNPDYEKKQRMGFWVGNTPKKIYMYAKDGKNLILPYGSLEDILPMICDCKIDKLFDRSPCEDFDATVPLYDYQSKAVDIMYKYGCGVLQAPAGSGKTQMGIALACKHNLKTLWVTHTVDLLNQSYDRARQYIDESKLGKIVGGKIEIGECMTFATVQTLSNCDISQFTDLWEVVIVDECHKVAGGVSKVTMFSKVLSNLCAKHKYGLSATVHRADGLIGGVFSLLGKVHHVVTEEEVGDKIVKVGILPRATGTKVNIKMLNEDGTLNFTSMINELSRDMARNKLIVHDLIENSEHYNIILSDRVSHLKTLFMLLNSKDAVMIDGTMTSKKGKAEREQALQDMRDGKKHFLFATYSLCKEGLDIPRLDRLYLTTPQKDYAVIVQSVGRVARRFDDKPQPIVYDYIDAIPYCQKAYKKRWTSYRKIKCYEVRLNED